MPSIAVLAQHEVPQRLQVPEHVAALEQVVGEPVRQVADLVRERPHQLVVVLAFEEIGL